jgi:hypothetical protein
VEKALVEKEKLAADKDEAKRKALESRYQRPNASAKKD